MERVILEEREVVKLGCMLARPIRPKDISEHLLVDFRTARRMLNKLCDKGWFTPIVNGTQIRQYQLNTELLKYLL